MMEGESKADIKNEFGDGQHARTVLAPMSNIILAHVMKIGSHLKYIRILGVYGELEKSGLIALGRINLLRNIWQQEYTMGPDSLKICASKTNNLFWKHSLY